MDQNEPQSRPPADVIRDGSLKATIWENDGDKGAYFTTTLAKTYEDKEGKLRDTHSFSSGDLLRVAELARQAYTRSNELRHDLKLSRGQNQESPIEGDRNARREAHQEKRHAQGSASNRAREDGHGNNRPPDHSL